MELRDVQDRVDAWISQFEEGYFSPQGMILRLTEELGELSREVNHQFGEKRKKPDEAPGSLAMELGDLLFVLVSMANSLDIDLEATFSAVMDKFERRDAQRWTKKVPE